MRRLTHRAGAVAGPEGQCYDLGMGLLSSASSPPRRAAVAADAPAARHVHLCPRRSAHQHRLQGRGHRRRRRLLFRGRNFQVVIDPGTSCKLTLKLKSPWDTALDVALRVCGLGSGDRQRHRRVAPSPSSPPSTGSAAWPRNRSSTGRCAPSATRCPYARRGAGAPVRSSSPPWRRRLRRPYQHPDHHRRRLTASSRVLPEDRWPRVRQPRRVFRPESTYHQHELAMAASGHGYCSPRGRGPDVLRKGHRHDATIVRSDSRGPDEPLARDASPGRARRARIGDGWRDRLTWGERCAASGC